MNRARKDVIERIVLDALTELADPEYQERVWVKGSPTEVSSLNEATAALYNDSGLDNALDRNAITFSSEIDGELRQLRSSLRSFLNRQTRSGIQEIIGSPEWDLVRQKAAQLHKALMKRQ